MSLAIDRPAILGGKPAVTLEQSGALRWPFLTGEDEAAVLQVMRDGDISTHPVTRELERDYLEFTGRRFALAHNNGTSALLAAFFALDLQPGSEVIVPSATFCADALPMLWLGLVPVFCESEPDRLGPDPVDIAGRITARTKAIVVVHLWGMPCKMTEIQALAKRHGLKIIEDASHAHGAVWRGIPCGCIGDISVFSLQGDKLAPAGEGGVFLTDHEQYYERAVCLGDITRIIQLQSAARRFAGTSFGLKTRMAPISAAIGRVQLCHLAARNEQRNRNLEYLSRRLEALGFNTYLAPAHVQRVYFQYVVRRPAGFALPTDTLIKALELEGCHVGPMRYPLLHQQPFFTEGHFLSVLRPGQDQSLPDYRSLRLPEVESSINEFILLPSFPSATAQLLDQYALAFEKVTACADMIAAKQKCKSTC